MIKVTIEFPDLELEDFDCETNEGLMERFNERPGQEELQETMEGNEWKVTKIE